MVAIKVADADAFVGRPDPKRSVILVFGPDSGLVSERVNALVKASVDDPGDPFALARLDAEELAAEPSRLVEEAQTMPLFGGCRVVIEAGDLRRNAPLRVLCERAKNAAAVPCNPDDEVARGRLIDDELRAAGLTLAPDARAMLIPLLGGDRQASRSEIAKLALYARGRAQIEADDVTAVVSDASALGLDDIVDAAFAGRAAKLETELGKARVAGSAPGAILFAAQRHVAQLHKWRTAIESGAAFSLDALQPPLYFRRKTAIEAALKGWSAARLADAMAELAQAVLQSRQTPDLARTIAERALLAIAHRRAASKSRS